MLTKIVFVMVLICLIGMAWARPETIAFACPTGYKYFYNRCIEYKLWQHIHEMEE